MTERIGALLTELADVDAPPAPAADPIWRHAGRTRIRRRAALAAAAVVLGAAALALTTLPTQPIIGPAGPARPAGSHPKVPPALARPFGGIPSLAELPTDRVIFSVTSDRWDRTFFVPRQESWCVDNLCEPRLSNLVVGADHRYRHIEDQPAGHDSSWIPPTVSVSPDGKYIAASSGHPSDAGDHATRTWRLVDVADAANSTSDLACADRSGWTRTGQFICAVWTSEDTVRLGVLEPPMIAGRLLYTDPITWRRSPEEGPVTWSLDPSALSSDATVALGSVAAEPNKIALVDPAGTVIRTIEYPGATEVRPLGWCGPDTVLVAADGDPSVIDLDDRALSRFPHPTTYGIMGCRPDGSMVLRLGDNLDKAALIRPDGSIAGEFDTTNGSSSSPTSIHELAVDAVAWEVGGSPAHVPGFRPTEWVDEALLVLVVVGGIGLIVVRRRRRRITAAAAEQVVVN